MGRRFDTKKNIQKMHVAHKLAVCACIACLLLCAGGCGLMEDDFFTYAPKSHIITKEEEADAYRSEATGDTGQGTVSKEAENSGQDAENGQTGDAGQEQEERLVGNVEYDESDGYEKRVKGIVRDMPFVYRGVRLSYTGDPEADFAVEEQTPGRPVPATVTQPIEQTGNPSEPQQGGEEEPPLKLGTVRFNGEFYEGHLKYDNGFVADITIAYSEAGALTPGTAVEILVPVEREYMEYMQYMDDDDDDDWPEPVRIMLCDAISGKNGRTYAIVRTREGSLDLLQYSYDYRNAGGEACHIRVIASFFGGASEAQGVELLDRLDFKYVGENSGL
ncbi:MAG: hypothetical protein IJ716_03625 [Lachnospiraceae bacterium]|nr:hypothetical protein [Lachnospiraceae bacterium]